VHGRIERGERPEEAAIRELREETGFLAERLYTTGVDPFYLPGLEGGTVTLAVVFAAVVNGAAAVTLSAEHQRFEWLEIDEARERIAWPRSRRALEEIERLLRNGDAGRVEDVLRLR
jgi:8-oxo-dGTP pyrophosphatase MutT (NUDIX family)